VCLSSYDFLLRTGKVRLNVVKAEVDNVSVDPLGKTRGSIAAADFDYHQQEDRRVLCWRQFVNLQLTRENELSTEIVSLTFCGQLNYFLVQLKANHICLAFESLLFYV